MGKPVVLAPREERVVEHAYWVPPRLGELSLSVKAVLPVAGTAPSESAPFFRKTGTITYTTPNSRCSELTPLPTFMGEDWMAKYRDGEKIPPFNVAGRGHFVFYTLPGKLAEKELDSIRQQREEKLAEICKFLGRSLDEPVNFFLFPDAESKRWCMAHVGDGMAFDTTIAEIYSDKIHVDPAHELMHIAGAPLGNPPAMLDEGLAVYMQTGHAWNGEPVDVIAARLLAERKLIPLAELILREQIGDQDDAKVAYPQSGSLVKFLIDKYGREKFLSLYGKLKRGGKDNELQFEKVLGVPLRTVEQKWRHWLAMQRAESL